VGRIDSRFAGAAIDHIAAAFRYAPLFPAIGPLLGGPRRLHRRL